MVAWTHVIRRIMKKLKVHREFKGCPKKWGSLINAKKRGNQITLFKLQMSKT